MCFFALFAGERCEGGASGVKDIILELGWCFGIGEACGSHGAYGRAEDLWLCDGAGDVAVYAVMHIWVHAFGVRSFSTILSLVGGVVVEVPTKICCGGVS